MITANYYATNKVNKLYMEAGTYTLEFGGGYGSILYLVDGKLTGTSDTSGTSLTKGSSDEVTVSDYITFIGNFSDDPVRSYNTLNISTTDNGVKFNEVLTTEELQAEELTENSASIRDLTQGGKVSLSNDIKLFGDSITSYNNYGSPSYGFFNWANTFLKQAFRVVGYNGIGGDTTSDMLERIKSDILDDAPSFCMMLGGANDILGNVMTYEQITANLALLMDYMENKGITVIIGTLTPLSFVSQDQKDLRDKVNEFIRVQASQRPVILADFDMLVSDIDGVWVVDYTIDGIHPNTRGAFKMGMVVYNALSNLIKSTNGLVSHNASKRTIGLNPCMVGDTSGIADGYSTSGATATYSKEARTDGIKGALQVITKATDDYTYFKGEFIADTAFDINEKYIVVYEVFVTDVTSLDDLSFQLTATEGYSTYLDNVSALSNVGYPINEGNWSGVVKSSEFTLPALTTKLRTTISFKGVATIKIGRCEVRKVI